MFDGFEIAPAWTPAAWWRVNGSYAFLHMGIRPRADSADTASADLANGSSPEHQVIVHSS